MAKIRTGSLAGNIRGSVGSDTFSQNRYGTYIRRRTIPTVVRTVYTERVRTLFSHVSRLWQTLTESQREAWRTWAESNPVRDKFGENQELTGSACFIRLNINALQAGGDVLIRPPEKAGPSGVSIIGIDTIGEGTIKINTEPQTYIENEVLEVSGYVTDSTGITYVENKLRVLGYMSKTTTAPIELYPYIVAKYGNINRGYKIFIRVKVIDKNTGQKSGGASIAFVYDWQ